MIGKKILKTASILLAAALSLSTGCARREKTKFSKAYLEFFDTVTQIIGYEEDREIFDQNCEAVYSLLEECHRLTDI